jgi:hypothetical protein
MFFFDIRKRVRVFLQKHRTDQVPIGRGVYKKSKSRDIYIVYISCGRIRNRPVIDP